MSTSGKRNSIAETFAPPMAQVGALLRNGVRSRFLEALEPITRDRVFDLASGAAPALERWSELYPAIRNARIVPLCLSVAAAAPFSNLDAVITTARVSLWVFALDDLFDEGGLSEAELRKHAEHYREIAFGHLEGTETDSLADALCEVWADLARYPLFESLGREWTRALSGTIDGMIRENEWRLSYQGAGSAALPSYDEYVANGLYSIGGPPHVRAEIITANDPSAPRHLDHLRAMERIASTCVRLANDLQSYSKEAAEGNINSLVLLGQAFQQQGLTSEEAYARATTRVLGDIDQGLTRLGELQALGATETKRPETAIADIARFVCEFYSRHDYHTFLTEEGNANSDEARS